MSWFGWAAAFEPDWPGGWLFMFAMPAVLIYLIYLARYRYRWRGPLFAVAVAGWGFALLWLTIADVGIIGLLISRNLHS